MQYVIGIDEVGRGCLAGPVTVAAVAIPKGMRLRSRMPLRDSKRLTKIQREAWFHHIKNYTHVRVAVAHVWPRVIDRINIARAANTAALRSCRRLVERLAEPKIIVAVWLDGGLYLGYHNPSSRVLQKNEFLARYRHRARTVPRADEKIPSVKLASIIAKVTRDRLMERLALRYPLYGLEIHKGYATRRHRVLLLAHGRTPIHRLTFLSKYPTLKGQSA